MEPECGNKRVKTESSMGKQTEPVLRSRKPEVRDDKVAVQTLDKGNSEHNFKQENECVFKRGGMCVNHGVMGQKFTEKTQSWGKKKNGLFGWRYGSRTKYVCQFNKGAESNRSMSVDDSHFRGVPKSNMSSDGKGVEGCLTGLIALGGPEFESDREIMTLPGISGMGYSKAGSLKSESRRISNEQKDFG